jgi:hypothetical protein
MAIWSRAMRFTMLAAVATLAGAAIVSACGSSSNNTSDSTTTAGASPQASDADLTARLQQDELLYAWVTLAANSPHELDTSLQGGTIEGTYLPTVRTIIRVLALTNWPDNLKDMATKFHDDAVTLYQGFNAGKTADELKDASSAVHEDWHMFTPAVGDEAAKSLPADAGGPEGSSSGSTPMPGMSTPMSDMTP